MKKFLLMLFGPFVFAAGIFAQSINFSGTWQLNSEKSQLNYDFSLAPKEIIINHDGNNLTVEKHSNFQGQDYTSVDKFTLDGAECTNPGFMESQKKSTALWSEDKTVLTIVSKMYAGDYGDVTITEIYKMDNDSLVLDSTASSSYGDLREVMVYNKK
ncbi:MAG: hypothetical protein ACUVTX_10860 [Bacteroidales bacterium]